MWKSFESLLNGCPGYPALLSSSNCSFLFLGTVKTLLVIRTRPLRPFLGSVLDGRMSVKPIHRGEIRAEPNFRMFHGAL